MSQGFNLIRWIVEAWNPCFHQWEVNVTMYDDPENPAVTKLVKTCMICGETQVEVIHAPARPERLCPPHKWVEVGNTHVVDDVKKVALGTSSTQGFRYRQRCSLCGDMRTVQAGFENPEDNGVVGSDPDEPPKRKPKRKHA